MHFFPHIPHIPNDPQKKEFIESIYGNWSCKYRSGKISKVIYLNIIVSSDLSFPMQLKHFINDVCDDHIKIPLNNLQWIGYSLMVLPEYKYSFMIVLDKDGNIDKDKLLFAKSNQSPKTGFEWIFEFKRVEWFPVEL